MALIDRQIIHMSMDQMTDVERMFGRHAQVNMDRIPASYAPVVEKTRVKCMEGVKPVGVIRSVAVAGIQGDAVSLADEAGCEWKLHSLIIAELLNQSREVLWFAATLQGFCEILSESADLMEQFFLEAWGSAFASRAGMFTADCARAMLKEEKLYCTSPWEPGQHGFDIHSQKEAFSILQPEEIGLRLTDSMLMIPSKSVSGLFGISETEDKRELIACDYCNLRDTCPSSYNVNPRGGVVCGLNGK